MPPSEQIRVLHVDDDPAFVDLAGEFLEREDDRVTVTPETDPAAAAERLRGDDPGIDCVVSDYDMPGTDGLELLDAVREAHPDLPFVLFTGDGSEDIASEAIARGVTDYLQKRGGTEQYTVLANRVGNAVENARMRVQRRRHLEAIESAREGISILDPDGRFIYVNGAYADLYGYDADELVGEHWGLLYPDGETARVRDEILPTVREEGYWRGRTTGRRADGTTFLEDHVLTTTDGGDLVCTVRDVSADEEHERERAFFEQAFEQIGTGVAAYDESGEITYANEHYARLLGASEDELTGRQIYEVNPAFDADQFADYWDSFDPGETRVHEAVHERFDDGERFPVMTTTTRVEIRGTDYHIGTINDITERKRRERQLQREIDRLDEFAGIVSHDLRNPLNVARGNLDLLAAECDSDHLSAIEGALDRMEDLIEDTLLLARQGETVAEPEPVDLSALTRECWQYVAADGATLVIDDDVTIEGDPERLRSLFENLFRNAIQHNDGDVTVRVGTDGRRALYVEDDGAGIPPADRETVFESGYTTDEEGTGFGLAIVEQIAGAHGWSVAAGEGRDGGARFEFHDVDVLGSA